MMATTNRDAGLIALGALWDELDAAWLAVEDALDDLLAIDPLSEEVERLRNDEHRLGLQQAAVEKVSTPRPPRRWRAWP